jgi:uncharacterized protein (DUF952 family)
MGQLIYKILTVQADAQLQRDGRLLPDGIDAADGFVHFSTAPQVTPTLDAHFHGHDDLIVLAVTAAACGDRLRWEPARNGALFPHLYGPLSADMVVQRLELNAGRDGLSAFLSGVAA